MASTSQYSTWPIITVSSDTAKPAPSPALNFVAAAASARLQHYDIGSLGIGNMDNIRKMDERMIGKGGFAVVELGKTIENDLVAVKRLRVSARNIQTDFESHLRHICLEARVLCHEPLRTHRNIVDILGYCLSSIAGYEIPFLALVLEYSSEGSLKHFLKNTGRDLPFEIVMDLAAQVADGLVALHQCKICHGDVKTQNALVFKDEEAWIVKISDFGQSIVGQIDECSVPVDCGPGTPLLHAPEIRNGILHAGDHFTIDDAIRTDIFSFGLLIWEILKRGESYFDRSWCVEMTKSTELDQMETYLEKLPHNGLLAKACDYIQKSLISPERKKILLPIFQKSLQDDSHKRSSMQEIRAHFERQIDTMSVCESQEIHATESERLFSWSTRQTLLELQQNFILGFQTLPFDFRRRIMMEFVSMSASEAFANRSRAHAAMCVAECYAFGFGVQYDRKQAVQWVHAAAQLGSDKAAAWYPRICWIDNVTLARNSAIMDFEANLSHLTSDAYLTNRIHLQINVAIQHIKSTNLSWDQLRTVDSGSYISSIGIFNSWERDDLPPLHCAALLGKDETISKLLCYRNADELSSRGLTAAHYACIGGHLSTLKLLLNHSALSKMDNERNITLLHLCIFFDSHDAAKAVPLILAIREDASTKVAQPIEWEYHDVFLAGTPLEWAVRVRHKSLVMSLLPFAQDDYCLTLAVQSFFWEIAEVILQYCRESKNIVVKSFLELCNLSVGYQYLVTIRRPFAHWLAHGPDHLVALEKTVQVCRKHHLIATGHGTHLTLTDIVTQASVEDDFSLLLSYLASCSVEEVKQKNEQGQSALEQALQLSEDILAWRLPLEAMISIYTVEELEVIGLTYLKDFSFLHLAISMDAMIGTRILLRKGVDVNQRSFGVLGETPLSLSASSKFAKEFKSLLLEFGAKDDVVDDFAGMNLLAMGLMRSQPNEELLRGILVKEDASQIIDALHCTSIRFLHRQHSLRAFLPAVNKRVGAEEDFPRTSTIKLGKDEMSFMWANLRTASRFNMQQLGLVLGREQLDSLSRLESVDSAQRPTSFDLVVNVREMKDILGTEETRRFLSLDQVETSATSQHSESLAAEGGGHDDIDSEESTDAEPRDQYWEELFKMQLSLPNWAKYVNETDSSGMTMLHRAAYVLDPESIALLLEAGADASIPLAIEGHGDILPLQIACSAARCYEGSRVFGLDPTIARLGTNSMEVASELLQWHHTRSDELFQGVTKLHLACRMILLDTAKDLRRDGYSMNAEGNWPGIDTPVTCDKMADHFADDDLLAMAHLV